MAFDFMVQLELTRRRCLVVGSGHQAAERAEALLAAGAEVEVLAERPSMPLMALTTRVAVTPRGYAPGDLDGVFLAVVTLEDDTDVEALWAEAEREKVLTSTLDDVEHCHFAVPAMVRRGDLKIAIASAGRAPALAKRLRQRLEAEVGPEYTELVDVIDEVRAVTWPRLRGPDAGARRISFAAWADRWGTALDDLDELARLLRTGRSAELRQRLLATLDDAVDHVDLPA